MLINTQEQILISTTGGGVAHLPIHAPALLHTQHADQGLGNFPHACGHTWQAAVRCPIIPGANM